MESPVLSEGGKVSKSPLVPELENITTEIRNKELMTQTQATK